MKASVDRLFQDLLAIAAKHLGSSRAALSVVDVERRPIEALLALRASRPYSDSRFFQQTIGASQGVFVVQDAWGDERFRHDQLVLDEPKLRSHVGVPIRSDDGVVRGCLSVFDQRVRRPSAANREDLQRLARQAGALLDLHDRTTRDCAPSASRRDDLLSGEHRRLRAIVDRMPALITHIDRDQRYTFANAHFTRVFGHDTDSMVGKTLREVCGPEVYADIEPYVDEVLAGREVLFEESGSRRGITSYQQSNYLPDVDADGAVVGFYAMVFDITGRKQAELELAEGQKRLRGITDNLPVLIAEFDGDRMVRFSNATYLSWLGVRPESMIGRPIGAATGGEYHAERVPYIERAYAGERVTFESIVRHGATERTLQSTYIPQLDEAGRVERIYALTSDISEQRARQREVDALARQDTLTKLPNRRNLEEHLFEAMGLLRRSVASIAVLYLDVDRFKSINDAWGHSGGDQVLVEFGARLRRCVRCTDLVARYAGDEFVALLHGIAQEDEARRVAEKIVSALREPFSIGGRALQVSASIGIAVADEAMAGPDDLLQAADHALYEAKQRGRNRYEVYSRQAADDAADR